MTQLREIYKCEICGNMVEVIHTGVGQLVCCGQPMKLLEAKTEEQGKEKHLPVVEKMADKVKVKVGSIPHPMEDKHYIEWVEVITPDKRVYRQSLQPGIQPEAEFAVTDVAEAREYCNIHGLWATRL